MQHKDYDKTYISNIITKYLTLLQCLIHATQFKSVEIIIKFNLDYLRIYILIIKYIIVFFSLLYGDFKKIIKYGYKYIKIR